MATFKEMPLAVEKQGSQTFVILLLGKNIKFFKIALAR